MPNQDDKPDGREGQSDDQPEGLKGLDAKYRPENLERAETIIQSLLRRLDERDAEKGRLQQQVDDLGGRFTAAEKAAKKKLEEEGNYKTLLDQANADLEVLRAYKDRATSLEEVIRTGNEALIQRIPEDKRGIVPADYPPEKLRAWLDSNLPLLLKPPAPDFDGGAGAGSGGRSEAKVQVTDADRRAAELAQASGHAVTAEQVAARRAKT